MNACGVTLLEMLIVLGVLSVALLLVAAQHRPDDLLLRQTAREVQLLFVHARLEAIKRGVPVLVAFEPERIESCVPLANQSTCKDLKLLREVKIPEKRLTYKHNFPSNLLWNPQGFPKQTGTGFAAGTLELNNQNRALKLILSAGGRMRQEQP